MKVDQNGLVEIDFCVALGNTPYGSWTRESLTILGPSYAYAILALLSHHRDELLVQWE
jgi:hypothetical protein